MTAPSVTYPSFTSGSLIESAKLNQNYQDIISACTDGSKAFSVSSMTVANTFTPNGGIIGKTDGVAPASGEVGELALNVSNSSITATYGDAASVVATGDLTTGTYLITDDITGYNDTRGSAGISSQAILLQVNGVTISDFTYLTYWRSSATAGDSECFGCTLCGVATVPAATTHTVNATIQTIGASGTPTNATSVTRAQGKLRAVRIA